MTASVSQLVAAVQAGKISFALLQLKQLLEPNSADTSGVSTTNRRKSRELLSTITEIEGAEVTLLPQSGPSASVPLQRGLVNLLKASAEPYQLAGFRQILSAHYSHRRYDLTSEDVRDIIRLCVQKSSGEEALRWLRLAMELPSISSGAASAELLDIATIEKLIPQAARARGTWDNVFFLLAELRMRQTVPSTSCLETLISCCVKTPHVHWAHAERFFWEIPVASRTEDIAASVIKTMVAAKQIDRAAAFIDRLNLISARKTFGRLSTGLYEEAFFAFVATEQNDKAINLTKRYLEIESSSSEQTSSAGGLLACIPEIEIDSTKFPRRKLLVVVSSIMASDFLRFRRATTEHTKLSSEKLFEMIMSENTSSSHSTVLRIFLRFTERLSYSCEALSKIAKKVQGISPSFISEADLSAMLRLYIDANLLSEALAVFRRLDEQNVLIGERLFSSLIRSLANADCAADVIEVYDKYLRRSDTELQARILNDSNKDNVHGQEKKMTDKKGVPRKNELTLTSISSEVLSAVLRSLRALGEKKVMCDLIFKEMPKRRVVPNLPNYIVLLSAHRDCKDYEEAVKLFTDIWESCIVRQNAMSGESKQVRDRTGGSRGNVADHKYQHRIQSFRIRKSLSEIEALVQVALESCAEGRLGSDAVRIIMLSEKLSQELGTRETSTQTSFYTIAYGLVARALSSPDNIAMLPQLLSSFMVGTGYSLVPPKMLLDQCRRLCREQDNKAVEDELNDLCLRLRYTETAGNL